MDVLIFKAVALSLVEGLTEFLPISSTGHLILLGHLLEFSPPFRESFTIIIQGSAILAICFEYRKQLLQQLRPTNAQAKKNCLFNRIFISFLPLAILGFLFAEQIKQYLFQPFVVAGAFIVGGLMLFAVEKKSSQNPQLTAYNLSAAQALKIGFFQALALIPGMSRAATSIIGAMTLGMNRKSATEYSFFLAIPTLLGATLYELTTQWSFASMEHLALLIASGCAAFFSAYISIRALIWLVSKHSLGLFAWYRIAFGLFIILSHCLGWINWQLPS